MWYPHSVLAELKIALSPEVLAQADELKEKFRKVWWFFHGNIHEEPSTWVIQVRVEVQYRGRKTEEHKRAAFDAKVEEVREKVRQDGKELLRQKLAEINEEWQATLKSMREEYQCNALRCWTNFECYDEKWLEKESKAQADIDKANELFAQAEALMTQAKKKRYAALVNYWETDKEAKQVPEEVRKALLEKLNELLEKKDLTSSLRRLRR